MVLSQPLMDMLPQGLRSYTSYYFINDNIVAALLQFTLLLLQQGALAQLTAAINDPRLRGVNDLMYLGAASHKHFRWNSGTRRFTVRVHAGKRNCQTEKRLQARRG